MSNQQHVQSLPVQAPTAMRELTAQELLAVVGGPIIHNGDAIVTPPPPASPDA
jgi:hypothetical protein